MGIINKNWHKTEQPQQEFICNPTDNPSSGTVGKSNSLMSHLPAYQNPQLTWIWRAAQLHWDWTCCGQQEFWAAKQHWRFALLTAAVSFLVSGPSFSLTWKRIYPYSGVCLYFVCVNNPHFLTVSFLRSNLFRIYLFMRFLSLFLSSSRTKTMRSPGES